MGTLNSSTNWGRFAVITAVTAAGLVAGFLLAHGIELFVHETDPRAAVPPCFEIGAPFHHRFRPDCTEELQTPLGPVVFSVNEDGLRDLPRAQLLNQKRRVLVLGDSFVEGWWSAAEQSLPTLLTARIPEFFFMNGGLRSTGPLMQVSRLPALLKIYSPEKILWLLNDTDGADDRLACSLLRDVAAPAEKMEFSTDDFALSGTTAWIAGHLGESQLGRLLRRRQYGKTWAELVHGESAGRCGECRGIEELAKITRAARIPVLATYLPSEGRPNAAVYAGEQSPREQILRCLQKSHIPAVRLEFTGLSLEEIDRLYWEGDFHFNPEGMVAAAERLVPILIPWLRQGHEPAKDAR